MTVTISEASSLTASESGTMLIRLITPGVGSSGVYRSPVLESAAQSRVFPAGTLMFADHPGEMDEFNRPERSIRDVAGVLLEDARWDGTALVAEARTYSPWTQVLKEMKDAIGVSIRATATLGETDPESGRPIVESLDEGISVDFVTKAGRGGAILEVYESASTSARLVVQETAPVREASNEQRITELRDLIRNAYTPGKNGGYAYIVDYDETARSVTFEMEGNGQLAGGIYTQSYTVTNDVASALEGEPVSVRRVVSYVPITESVPVIPAGQSTTHESEEDNMPQIEESRLAALEEAGRRVPTLESERDAAVQRAQEAETAAAEALRQADRATAERIVAEADHQFNVLERRGLLAELPLQENGRLDVAAFTTQVQEAVAASAESQGSGQVRGLGGTPEHTNDEQDLSESELDAELARISGRVVKES